MAKLRLEISQNPGLSEPLIIGPTSGLGGVYSLALPTILLSNFGILNPFLKLRKRKWGVLVSEQLVHCCESSVTELGQIVWLDLPLQVEFKKLSPHYIGPYKIFRQINHLSTGHIAWTFTDHERENEAPSTHTRVFLKTEFFHFS